MYCPQCGQQQVSDELRFCSRCGFQLNGVTELLATGGLLPGLEKKSDRKPRSPRYEGVRQGTLIMFVAMVLVPLADVLPPYGEVLPVMIIMAGLMRLLYAVIFQEGAAKQKKQDSAPSAYTPSVLPRRTGGAVALPPSQSVPVENYVPRRVETAEMKPPPSVTEHTTKLLDDPNAQDGLKS
jgi:hypothetical protein